MESEAYARFLRSLANPVVMETLDELRRADFARLDKLGQVYLDYTGGGLYGESQLVRHHEWLSSAVLGNPHSENPASAESTQSVENARSAVLAFFGASPGEYQVVFTANASSALKLVGEAYPFTSGGRYLMTYDNHNSVNGIREYARRGGSIVQYVPVRNPDLRLDVETLFRALEQPATGEPRLFAYPAQSNFSGVQHPLDWVREASDRGWDVILDCAAFAPTNRLDLGSVRPDFAVVSFYKMFGYPTGVGALIARRTALEKLRRPWFAGGTIIVASVQDESWYSLAPAPAGFEDGTVNYLSLSAVEMGLEYLERIGMEAIHERVMALTGWLLDQMSDLRHGNGTPVIRSSVQPQHSIAEGPRLSMSSIQAVMSSMCSGSRAWQHRMAYQSGRGASATREMARLLMPSRRKTWPVASPPPRALLRWPSAFGSSRIGRARSPIHSAPRSDCPPTLATSIVSCAS